MDERFIARGDILDSLSGVETSPGYRTRVEIVTHTEKDGKAREHCSRWRERLQNKDQEPGALLSAFGHTRPMASPRKVLAESECKTCTAALSDFIIFPSLPRNLRKACACSWRTAVMDSTESHFINFALRGWSASLVPVCFL